MRKATQFLLLAAVFIGLVMWSAAQTPQKKVTPPTGDHTTTDDAAQSGDGTDTGSGDTAKKKKKGTSSTSSGGGSGSGDNPTESGVAQPTRAVQIWTEYGNPDKQKAPPAKSRESAVRRASPRVWSTKPVGGTHDRESSSAERLRGCGSEASRRLK